MATLLLTLAPAAWADEGTTRTATTPPPPPPNVEVLQEIEVKAKKDARVETLEVREVRELSSTDLGEALSAQGVASRVRRGPIGNDVVVRWFQRDNLTLTIDGALVQGACPNRMDPPAFHVDYAEVSRVEVKKGPFDVTVPGGLGGTIHVEPRRPHPGLNLEANLSGASNQHGEGSALLGYATRWGDLLGGYAYKLGRPYTAGDGIPITAIYPAASPNRYRDTSTSATAYSIQTAWAQGGASFLKGRDRLQVAYTYQGAESVIYPYLVMDAVHDNTHRLNASYRVAGVGPFHEIAARFYFSTVDHLMNDERRCSSAASPGGCSGALERPYSMETQASSQMLGGRLEASVLGDALRVGVDAYDRQWSATTTRLNRMTSKYMAQALLPDVDLVDAGAWARYARGLGRGFRLSAGARVDVAHTRARLGNLAADQASIVNKLYENAWGAPQPLSATDVLASANVEVEWKVGGPVTLFLGVGHGARAPDPQERYSALSGSAAMGMTQAKPGRVGNPGIAPPRNTEADLGLRISNRWLLARAQAFGSYVSDAIVVGGVTGADGVPSTTFNNVTAWITGAELSARVALGADFYLGTALAYTHGWNTTTGVPLQETPPFGGHVGLRWDIERVFVEVEEQFALAQDRVDTTVGEQTTPAYYVTNFRAGGSYRGFKLMAGITNLLNQRYFQHLSYLRDPFASGLRVPEPGYSFTATLQYALE